jgi:hypothetical protein
MKFDIFSPKGMGIREDKFLRKAVIIAESHDLVYPQKELVVLDPVPEAFLKLLDRIQHRFLEGEPSPLAWAEPFRIVREVFKEVLPLPHTSPATEEMQQAQERAAHADPDQGENH